MLQNPLWSILRVVKRKFLFLESPFFTDDYMRRYTRYLQKCGMDIADYDEHGFIHPSVWFDSSERYSLIKVGRAVTLSRDVVLLTHDYSIRNAINAFESNSDNVKYKFLKSIVIGDNVFIGARAVILPGTTIGDNVIIGAGAVVKGNVPEKTIWGGLPRVRYARWRNSMRGIKKSKTIRLNKVAYVW